MQKPAGCMGHRGRRGHVSQAKHSVNAVGSWHSQIHYGQYQREQLFEAARRSRACAYLADDDHSPPGAAGDSAGGLSHGGVRTGASFVKSDETGVLVDRLPPGRL